MQHQKQWQSRVRKLIIHPSPHVLIRRLERQNACITITSWLRSSLNARRVHMWIQQRTQAAKTVQQWWRTHSSKCRWRQFLKDDQIRRNRASRVITHCVRRICTQRNQASLIITKYIRTWTTQRRKNAVQLIELQWCRFVTHHRVLSIYRLTFSVWKDSSRRLQKETKKLLRKHRKSRKLKCLFSVFITWRGAVQNSKLVLGRCAKRLTRRIAIRQALIIVVGQYVELRVIRALCDFCNMFLTSIRHHLDIEIASMRTNVKRCSVVLSLGNNTVTYAKILHVTESVRSKIADDKDIVTLMNYMRHTHFPHSSFLKGLQVYNFLLSAITRFYWRHKQVAKLVERRVVSCDRDQWLDSLSHRYFHQDISWEQRYQDHYFKDDAVASDTYAFCMWFCTHRGDIRDWMLMRYTRPCNTTIS